MRKVTVFSTTGKNADNHETDALTWGNLKEELHDLDFDNMKAITGESRVTLEHDDAVLPEGSFTIFLMPIKTKSGALTRLQLFAEIKQFVTNNPSKKSFFIIDGKNMTQLGTTMLQDLYERHILGELKKADFAPKEDKFAAAAKAATIPAKITGEQTLAGAYEQINALTQRIEALEKMANGIVASTPVAPIAAAVAERVLTQTEILMKQAREIAKGLTGLKSF